MKSILAALVLSAGLLALAPTEASAVYCEARSPTGSYGWARHNYSFSWARRRALWEYAQRTPRGYWCRIRYCA